MKAGSDYIGIGVGAFIFNEAGELFLMKRGKEARNEVGFWIVPGGMVEFGETMHDAVIREVRDEIGVDIQTDGQLPAFDIMLPDEGEHWVTNIFTARITSGTPEIMEPGKCDQIGWFPLTELPSPIARADREALAQFIN